MFLDVSDLDFIYLTEILLDGTVVSRVPLVPNTLALEEKVRETIYYRKVQIAIFWVGMVRECMNSTDWAKSSILSKLRH